MGMVAIRICIYMYILVPPAYRCLIGNVALIGRAVLEKAFENIDGFPNNNLMELSVAIEDVN